MAALCHGSFATMAKSRIKPDLAACPAKATGKTDPVLKAVAEFLARRAAEQKNAGVRPDKDDTRHRNQP